MPTLFYANAPIRRNQVNTVHTPENAAVDLNNYVEEENEQMDYTEEATNEQLDYTEEAPQAPVDYETLPNADFITNIPKVGDSLAIKVILKLFLLLDVTNALLDVRDGG
jgi:hypothetical protein